MTPFEGVLLSNCPAVIDTGPVSSDAQTLVDSNSGTISLASGQLFAITSGTLTNLSAGTLTGGTYLIAGALLGEPLTVQGAWPKHLRALIDSLREEGRELLAEVFDDARSRSHAPSLVAISSAVAPVMPRLAMPSSNRCRIAAMRSLLRFELMAWRS